MVRNSVSVIIVAALLLSLQAGTARADLLQSLSIFDRYPGISSEGLGVFAPAPYDYDDTTASMKTYVAYTGSSLFAQGAAAFTGNGSQSPGGAFILNFTPTIDTTFYLSLSLRATGQEEFVDGYDEAQPIPWGGVAFSGGAYSLIGAGPNPATDGAPYITSPITLNLTGALYAGVNYTFDIFASVVDFANPWEENLWLLPASSPRGRAFLRRRLLGLQSFGT